MMIKPRFFLVLLALWVACFAALAEGPAPLSLEEDWVFLFEGETYSPGQEAAPLIAAIEAAYGPMEVDEFDSCLFQGKDKEIYNDEIVLGTYPLGPNGSDQLETVLIIGGDHATARGITIGSTKEQVLAAYGEDCTQSYDELLYQLEGTDNQPILVFTLDLDTGTVASYYMMLGAS